MSETKETDDKTAGGRKTLNVKRTVEQNFSHGRSKPVLVETKHKRPVEPGSIFPVGDAVADSVIVTGDSNIVTDKSGLVGWARYHNLPRHNQENYFRGLGIRANWRDGKVEPRPA